MKKSGALKGNILNQAHEILERFEMGCEHEELHISTDDCSMDLDFDEAKERLFKLISESKAQGVLEGKARVIAEIKTSGLDSYQLSNGELYVKQDELIKVLDKLGEE